MSKIASQVLKFEDSTKAQKPKYLENEISFSLQVKKNPLIIN